jgi:ATP-dependent DNA helicase RecG
MTRTELLELIRNGENSGVEFKRDVLQPRELAKEIVAFANFEGGVVLLGVDDDGSIQGLTRGDDLEQFVVNTCRDKIRPPLVPYFEIIRDVDNGRDVAAVRVSRGYDVHAVWHDNRHLYYRRVGTHSVEPSPEELARLFQQRGDLRAELRPVSGTTFRDLDFRRLTDYFRRRRQQDSPGENDEQGWTALLANTELMVEDGVDVAGLLLFGLNPNRYLPHAGITAVAFPGSQKDYAVRERLSIRGPMTPLFDNGQLRENGLVEQAVEFINRNSPPGVRFEGGIRRVDVPAYPVDVLREGIVNALIHRDYLLSNSDIEVSLFDNRLEIISPGRLPNGITPERMRVGCRAARNQLLKDTMRDYGYLENMGLGIPRKIIPGMRHHNGTEPELIVDGEQFTLRLFRTAPT